MIFIFKNLFQIFETLHMYLDLTANHIRNLAYVGWSSGITYAEIRNYVYVMEFHFQKTRLIEIEYHFQKRDFATYAEFNIYEILQLSDLKIYAEFNIYWILHIPARSKK